MPSRSKDTLIVWDDCRGRNGFDPPHVLPDDMAAEVFNIVYEGGLLLKRRGSATVSLTGTFDGFAALYRFVPGQSDLAAELIFATLDATTKIMRIAAGTAAVSLTLTDAVTSHPTQVTFATLNGKCFIAYDSSENRLHVFDPHISSTTVRRVGLRL